MKIRQALIEKAVELVGGKDSVAYKSSFIAEELYKDLIHQLKRQFGIKKFEEIYMHDEDVVLELIRDFDLPLYLEELITSMNEG